MSTEAQAILSEAADVVDQTLDILEATEPTVIIKHDPLIIAGAAIIGLSVGALVGYRLAKKYLEPKYAAIAEEEIHQARVLYAHRTKDGMDTPTVAVNKLIPDDHPEAQAALAKYQGKDVHVTVVPDGVEISARVDQPEAPRVQNVFEQPAAAVKHEGWDYETELARRTNDKPFIVTQEEYLENADELECITVTYYEGDDVLADESDGIISDIDGNVGRANLKKFGHGSGEEHIVYVFNKKSGLGYEILRNEGRYSSVVLGMDEVDDDEDEPTERMPRRGRRLSDD